MGSQNVTNFPAAKKARIRGLLKGYSEGVPHTDPWLVGAATVGPITGSNPFVQSIASPSVETAFDLLSSFADEVKKAKNPGRVYQEYGISPEIKKPFGALSAAIGRALSERLTASQADTDSAFAAKDAIPKTLLEIVKHAFPRKSEAADATQEEIARALKRISSRDVAVLFFENVANSLIARTLEAARPGIPPAQIESLKEKIRRSFVPDLTRLITGMSRHK